MRKRRPIGPYISIMGYGGPRGVGVKEKAFAAKMFG
jgi:hypothetical protein